MSAYRAVLFDAGDTLWHMDGELHEVWTRLLAKHGIEVSEDELKPAVAEVYERFLPEYSAFEARGSPVADHELQDFWRRVDSAVLERISASHATEAIAAEGGKAFRESFRLFPETVDVLEALRAEGRRMAIVSNGSDQRETAEFLAIAGYFETILGSAHLGFAKPGPEIYRMALDALGVTPGEAIMVGDTLEADVEGPMALGIQGVHLQRVDGPRPRQPTGSAQTASGAPVISDLWGLVEIVRRLE